MTQPRIVLADGQELIQQGLARILEGTCEIVGTVGDGKSLLEAVSHLRPALVILSPTMPRLSGIDAARQIRKWFPSMKLLFLTLHANPEYLREALNVGASGYILKSSSRQQILDAVKSVLAGHRYISDGIVAEDFDVSKWQGSRATRSGLTLREREVLQMLAEGRSAKEAAGVLNVSAKTVAFHRNNLRRKLGVKKTIELLRRAIDEQLI